MGLTTNMQDWSAARGYLGPRPVSDEDLYQYIEGHPGDLEGIYLWAQGNSIPAERIDAVMGYDPGTANQIVTDNGWAPLVDWWGGWLDENPYWMESQGGMTGDPVTGEGIPETDPWQNYGQPGTGGFGPAFPEAQDQMGGFNPGGYNWPNEGDWTNQNPNEPSDRAAPPQPGQPSGTGGTGTDTGGQLFPPGGQADWFSQLPAQTEAYQAQAYGWNPVEYQIDPETMTVSGQLEALLAEDSPYMQMAKQYGLERANASGLLNSSMAAEAAWSAALEAAVPIAGADAEAYLTQQLANQEVVNQAARDYAQWQTEVSKANAEMANHTNELMLSINSDQAMKYADLALQERLAALNIDENLKIQTQNAATQIMQTGMQWLSEIDQMEGLSEEDRALLYDNVWYWVGSSLNTLFATSGVDLQWGPDIEQGAPISDILGGGVGVIGGIPGEETRGGAGGENRGEGEGGTGQIAPGAQISADEAEAQGLPVDENGRVLYQPGVDYHQENGFYDKELGKADLLRLNESGNETLQFTDLWKQAVGFVDKDGNHIDYDQWLALPSDDERNKYLPQPVNRARAKELVAQGVYRFGYWDYDQEFWVYAMDLDQLFAEDPYNDFGFNTMEWVDDYGSETGQSQKNTNPSHWYYGDTLWA